MLKKWTLSNFKAIADKATLDLAPITVLCGANSSGKSSILQSILLVSQTLRAKPGEQPLLFNGEYVRLGYISDILHDSKVDAPFAFGFELDGDAVLPGLLTSTEGSTSSISLTASFNSESYSSDQPLARVERINIFWGDKSSFKVRVLQNSLYDLALPKYSEMVIPADIRAALQQGLYYYELGDPPKNVSRIPPFVAQVSLRHFFPSQILETYDVITEQLENIIRQIVTILRTPTVPTERLALISEMASNPALDRKLRDYIKNSLVNPPKLVKQRDRQQASRLTQDINRSIGLLGRTELKEWLKFLQEEIPPPYRRDMADMLSLNVRSLQSRSENLRFHEIGVRAIGIPDDLRLVLNTLTEFFSNRIYYVGPLRESPQYIYSLPPYPELTHVGTKGEFTASVLEHFKGTKVDYPLPPDEVKKGNRVDQAPLAYALRVWLEAMGLLENVTTTDRGKMGTELTVRSIGVSRDLDLTSIGVGVSQVLPTLVMGLVAPRGTTFLLEQPELHLHPKVQAALADFLLGLTHVGKQCIVETHSEYIINRLRRRVAEDESDSLSDEISIYFVERERGNASFQKVDLNAYGAVLKWPKGFFDEGPGEAQLIMEAAMRKRRRAQPE